MHNVNLYSSKKLQRLMLKVMWLNMVIKYTASTSALKHPNDQLIAFWIPLDNTLGQERDRSWTVSLTLYTNQYCHVTVIVNLMVPFCLKV